MSVNKWRGDKKKVAENGLLPLLSNMSMFPNYIVACLCFDTQLSNCWVI